MSPPPQPRPHRSGPPQDPDRGKGSLPLSGWGLSLVDLCQPVYLHLCLREVPQQLRLVAELEVLHLEGGAKGAANQGKVSFREGPEPGAGHHRVRGAEARRHGAQARLPAVARQALNQLNDDHGRAVVEVPRLVRTQTVHLGAVLAQHEVHDGVAAPALALGSRHARLRVVSAPEEAALGEQGLQLEPLDQILRGGLCRLPAIGGLPRALHRAAAPCWLRPVR
eukprot:CAMPEP_0197942230 /NCGR_PEP_ID=MMETSP1439-20131203/124043_1 /TAXON_ID=66791 /ORGANISM="Gonyaulax spinifera, Strain CCMP409" /LENGTH=222 /DNA_ID=CAMNT_0043565473 /DNA_START=15 /DNA_END=679 /DNA_ORIENTATION=+